MIKGVYFPGLRPEATWTAALPALLQRLVVYDPIGTESATTPPSVEVRVVAPLGPERVRFLALLREMTGREAEFFRGQMLATRSGRDRDEATVGSLAGALRLGADRAAENRERLTAERIWQARLFLQLAEVVSEAEQEVSRGLAAVAGRQAEMLKALQGGDDNEEEAEEFLPPGASARAGWRKAFRSRDQLAAWAVFYLLNPDPEVLLLTDDPEAAALLVEGVEKLAPGRAQVLPELGLGAGNPAPLAAALSELVQGNLAAGQAAWAAGAAGTVGVPGPTGPLRLWVLPGKEFRQVMLALSGLAADSGAAPATPYVLVGVAGPAEFTGRG